MSPPKPIPVQSILHKTTTCLTRPAATFFDSQMEKNLSKTVTAKLYPAEKWEVMHKEKRFSNYGLLYNSHASIIFTFLLFIVLEFL